MIAASQHDTGQGELLGGRRRKRCQLPVWDGPLRNTPGAYTSVLIKERSAVSKPMEIPVLAWSAAFQIWKEAL